MPGSINPLSLLQGNPAEKTLIKKSDGTALFGRYFKDALKHTDQLQKEADRAVQKLAGGNLDNLHDVMIAVEQAQLSLQLTVQVTNKLIQAYQELYRMQI